MQIASTVDYATESWFWTIFTGALNHQVAHHLFPGVLQIYYPQITPIVERTCAEFGLCYFCLPLRLGRCARSSWLLEGHGCHPQVPNKRITYISSKLLNLIITPAWIHCLKWSSQHSPFMHGPHENVY